MLQTDLMESKQEDSPHGSLNRLLHLLPSMEGVRIFSQSISLNELDMKVPTLLTSRLKMAPKKHFLASQRLVCIFLDHIARCRTQNLQCSRLRLLLSIPNLYIISDTRPRRELTSGHGEKDHWKARHLTKSARKLYLRPAFKIFRVSGSQLIYSESLQTTRRK